MKLKAQEVADLVGGIVDGDTLAVGQTFTVDVDASVPTMAHLNSLTEGITFIKVSDTLTDIDGPNKDAEFNLAHLPSDAVFARGMGSASETGRAGSSGLEADKTYIIRTVASSEID